MPPRSDREGIHRPPVAAVNARRQLAQVKIVARICRREMPRRRVALALPGEHVGLLRRSTPEDRRNAQQAGAAAGTAADGARLGHRSDGSTWRGDVASCFGATKDPWSARKNATDAFIYS
jgi:hypothetical protein